MYIFVVVICLNCCFVWSISGVSGIFTYGNLLHESVGLLVMGMLFPPMHKPTENAIRSNTYTTPMLTSSFDRYSYVRHHFMNIIKTNGRTIQDN